jgi:hypothetical protein
MTALFTEGFEAILDQMDLINRGLLIQNAAPTLGSVCSQAIPSRTGYPGKALYLRGPYSTLTAQQPMAGANWTDFGLIPMGQSINALWQAGGFVVGFSAAFNAQQFLEIAPGGACQLAYDGAVNYWAITRNSSSGAWGIAYSSDLQNWNIPLSTPGINQGSQISVVGSGINATIIVGNTGTYSGAAAVYSTNMGMTWNATNSSGNYRAPCVVPPGNGNAAYLSIQISGTALTICPVTAPTMTAAVVPLTTVNTIPNATYDAGFCKCDGKYFFAVGYSGAGGVTPNLNGGYPNNGVSFCPVGSDVTVAANWKSTGYALPGQISDVIIFNNNIVVAGVGGVYYTPLANPTQWNPSPSFYSTNAKGAGAFNTWGIYSLASNGSILIAAGQDYATPSIGAIYLSTDGINWTKQNQFFYSGSSSGMAPTTTFTNVIWDGAQFVMTGGENNGMVVVSPDGKAWETKYVTDYPEQAGTATQGMAGVFFGSVNPITNIFTPWNAASTASYVNGLGLVAFAGSGATRQIGLGASYANAQYAAQQYITLPCPAIPLGQQPGTALTNYYELIFTPTATNNAFTAQWAINGTVETFSGGPWQLAPTADTTGVTQLFFNLPRNGNYNVIDDIYLTTMNGANNVGRLGPQSVFAVDPSTVVGTPGFSNTSGTLTNAQTVATELGNAENYLYATTKNKADTYHTTNTVPATFNVRALQVDAAMGAQGPGPAPAGTVGVVSGSASKQSNSVTPTAGLYSRASLFMETDPNTNAAFTAAGLNALELTITKTN